MPKSSSSDLFILIKSLNKFEKGYIKMYASRRVSKSERIYIQLLDAIDSQSQYNEQKILRKLKTISPARLPELKHYLYHTILNGLELFHAENTIVSKLKKLLSHAVLLYEKSLYPQCTKVLFKAKKNAYGD